MNVYKVPPRINVGPSIIIPRQNSSSGKPAIELVRAAPEWHFAAWRLSGGWDVKVTFLSRIPFAPSVGKLVGTVIAIDGQLHIWIDAGLPAREKLVTLAHEAEHIRRRQWRVAATVREGRIVLSDHNAESAGQPIDEDAIDAKAHEIVERAEAAIGWPADWPRGDSYRTRVLNAMHSW